jgi:hypothetical protein
MLQAATPDQAAVAGTASPSVVAGVGAVPAPTAKGDGTFGGPIVVTELTEGKDSLDSVGWATALIAPKANSLIILSLAWSSSNTATDPTVSGGTVTWLPVISFATSNIEAAGIWVARTASGAPPAPFAVAFGWGSTKTGVTWHVVQLENVDLSGADAAAAIVQSNAGQTAAGQTTDDFKPSPLTTNNDDLLWAVWELSVSDVATLDALGVNTTSVYNDTRLAPAVTVTVDYMTNPATALPTNGFAWSWLTAGRAVRALAQIDAAYRPVAGVGTVPAPTAFSAGTATATPATVARTGAVPAPTAMGNGTNIPAVVAGVGAVPAPTATGGSAPGKTRRMLIRGTGGPR